jgi:hypothetical protein
MQEVQKTSNNNNFQWTMKTQMILIQKLFMCQEWSFWLLPRQPNGADTLSIITIERQKLTLVNELVTVFEVRQQYTPYKL